MTPLAVRSRCEERNSGPEGRTRSLLRIGVAAEKRDLSLCTHHSASLDSQTLCSNLCPPGTAFRTVVVPRGVATPQPLRGDFRVAIEEAARAEERLCSPQHEAFAVGFAGDLHPELAFQPRLPRRRGARYRLTTSHLCYQLIPIRASAWRTRLSRVLEGRL